MFLVVAITISLIPFATQNTIAATQLSGPERGAISRYEAYIGTKGMVVSDDRVASEWGAEILRSGGNAIDAAVATAFALSVTRPHYASIGGGGFLLYCPRPKASKPAQCQAIDYREQAPAAATRDMYIRDGRTKTQLAQNGALASGVPGVVAGLLKALEQYGTLSRQEILKKPIELAETGYTFTPYAETAALERWPAMNPEARKIFGCSKETLERSETQDVSSGPLTLTPCPTGTNLKQPDLAKVLKRISKDGIKGFYEGPTAQDLVKGIQKAGGIITVEDLKSYRVRERIPLETRFLNHNVVTMPPPSGGVYLLQLLHYAELAKKSGLFESGFGSVNALHALIHSMALAYYDRAHYLGDPDFFKIPLTRLLSPNYLSQRWKSFQLAQSAIPVDNQDLKETVEPQFTTHFSAIDKYGNAVALTTTINENYGSGFVPPGTGVVMNNEMDDFSTHPNVHNQYGLIGLEANSIAPHKRPLSSMAPTIVRDENGFPQIVIGAAGGPRITTSVFLTLINRLIFGMQLNDAVAAPRIHQQWIPNIVLMESYGFPIEVRTQLEKIGYKTEEVPKLAVIHALERLKNGRVLGISDFRGEGNPVAE